jgi:hypothetical protein
MEQRLRDINFWYEFLGTILLGVAAVAIAWSGYQEARWGGVATARYGKAGALRTESVRSSTMAGEERVVDLSVFQGWLDAYLAGDSARATFYRLRFRPEFRPAFDAWIRSNPKGSPRTPFSLPQYRIDEDEQALAQEAGAERASEQAQAATRQGEAYIRTGVNLAIVLFLAGTLQHLRSRRLRAVLLTLATVLCIAALVALARYKVA